MAQVWALGILALRIITWEKLKCFRTASWDDRKSPLKCIPWFSFTTCQLTTKPVCHMLDSVSKAMKIKIGHLSPSGKKAAVAFCFSALTYHSHEPIIITALRKRKYNCIKVWEKLLSDDWTSFFSSPLTHVKSLLDNQSRNTQRVIFFWFRKITMISPSPWLNSCPKLAAACSPYHHTHSWQCCFSLDLLWFSCIWSRNDRVEEGPLYDSADGVRCCHSRDRVSFKKFARRKRYLRHSRKL